MMTLRRGNERGHAEHGWLDSYHTFSFADYFDPKHVEFRALRVINEDRVAAGQGFGMHGHRDMEIITYVLEGSLAHEDSMGTGSVLERGDVQRMSAGTGVRHSEFNGSKTEPVHFLQIWIQPDRQGHAPSYEEKHFDDAGKRGRLRVVASGDGRDGSVSIHQDATLYAGLFDCGEKATLSLAAGRHAFIHVARGTVRIAGEVLKAGDAAAFDDARSIEIEGIEGIEGGNGGEVLVFDLA